MINLSTTQWLLLIKNFYKSWLWGGQPPLLPHNFHCFLTKAKGLCYKLIIFEVILCFPDWLYVKNVCIFLCWSMCKTNAALLQLMTPITTCSIWYHLHSVDLGLNLHCYLGYPKKQADDTCSKNLTGRHSILKSTAVSKVTMRSEGLELMVSTLISSSLNKSISNFLRQPKKLFVRFPCFTFGMLFKRQGGLSSL